MKLSHEQQVVDTVLRRMVDLCLDNEDFAVFLQDYLEEALTAYHEEDGFGTEGQTDPRGDFRNGDWSMWNVEGVEE